MTGSSSDDESSDDLNPKVSDPTEIADDTHFYFILTKQSLNSLTHF